MSKKTYMNLTRHLVSISTVRTPTIATEDWSGFIETTDAVFLPVAAAILYS